MNFLLESKHSFKNYQALGIFFGSLVLSNICNQSAFGFFIDGEGHYSAVGETETAPAFSSARGMDESIRQSFRLLGEVRPSDRSSFFLEFKLFPDQRQSYMGDNAQPQDCSKDRNSNTGSNSNCEGRQQDPSFPDYKPYTPFITQAFVRYATDYCLLEAGRRPRDWGIGIFLDSGKNPFSRASSVFDGIGCTVNIQKSQVLAFSVGYDKLAETGAINELLPEEKGYTRGAYTRMDDLSQFYFTIEYDDRKANAGSGFNRQIGFYVSNVVGPAYNTDLKFADLYTGFHFRSFVLRNEVLFRLGRSSDASWTRYGGRSPDPSPDNANDLDSAKATLTKNDLDAIGFAGDMDLTLSSSGSFVGPSEYFQGNAQRHALILQYAYAPGDRDGYRTEYDNASSVMAQAQRNNKVPAMGFHKNYKPTMLLWRDRAEREDLRVDGVYDPARFMNAYLVGLAYRYESLAFGNFEMKLITASLSESIPEDIKLAVEKSSNRPIGYGGQDLGYELDLKYDRNIGKDLNLGLAAAFALPGAAWDVDASRSKRSDFLLQSQVTFKF